ncbi:MAG: hypothetical protein R6V17_06145 [Halanaerobacter sp.]
MLKIEFREKLIVELKKHPDLYNEIRAEILTPRLLGEKQENNYTSNPSEDKLLARTDEEDLIRAIIINLNYFMEYEREMREGDF